jgi:glycosyltransferase involved in cell wall biosynthesis
MRVSLVHNFYRGAIPSGEDLNVLQHQELMGAGIEVSVLSASNAYLAEHPIRGRLQAALAATDARHETHRVVRSILGSRPDVVHIENLVPLLPERVIGELLLAGVPVVRRWGNFRFRCPNANNFRDGSPCHACDTRSVKVPAVKYKCYAGSRAASALVAVRQNALRVGSNLLHLPVSGFLAGHLAEAGVEPSQIAVVPNSVMNSKEPERPPNYGATRDLVFVGSLAAKKGLPQLLDAWERGALEKQGARLLIIGDGPLRSAVERSALRVKSVEFLGMRPYWETRHRMHLAHAVIVPSVWDEPFGRVVIEAMAEGTPVIASDRGALPELLGESGGIVFDGSDSHALPRALIRVLNLSDVERAQWGESARAQHAERFSIPAIRRLWMNVYRGTHRSWQAPLTRIDAKGASQTHEGGAG